MKRAVKMLAMTLAAALMLTALPATEAGAEPERPVEVNRTYEKIGPSPAAAVISYDLSLKLDTQHDRLTETVKAELQNNTDAAVETLYLRFLSDGVLRLPDGGLSQNRGSKQREKSGDYRHPV